MIGGNKVKRNKQQQKEQQNLLIADAYNEGFRLGYTQGKKEGERSVMQKLSDDNNDNTAGQSPIVSRLPKL